VAALGMHNSLSQLVLKLTAPGVPDIYQGADLWDFRLVDPDNRRPVDYTIRIQLLDEILRGFERDKLDTMRRLLQNWRDGGIKLAITAALLSFRRQHERLFELGAYEPVLAEGAQADRVYAYLRRDEESTLLIAIERYPGRAASGWTDTAITQPDDAATGEWLDLFTGVKLRTEDKKIPADALFANLPVAALIKLK
jgi:(1->4)-alpha-D-glucan 1-alpha-D-glucosylmutase